MSTVEFSRYDKCEIRTNRRGRGLQHGHIILIEARRWQIYSARAWPEDLSPILHARFLHLSFLSRGLDPSHRAAVARAFHIGKRLGVLCLDHSWKISATGAAKCFHCLRKRKITARIAPHCPPPFSTVGRESAVQSQARCYAAGRSSGASQDRECGCRPSSIAQRTARRFRLEPSR